MPVTRLQLSNVGPFKDIEFNFDGQVNVVTGSNNTGKSTLLWALGELIVYPFTMPDRLLSKNDSKWKISFVSNMSIHDTKGAFPAEVTDSIELLRSIGPAFYIPAQRQATNFRPSGPTSGHNIESRIDAAMDLLRQSRPSMFTARHEDNLRHELRIWVEASDPELAKRNRLLATAASTVSDRSLIQKIIDLDYAAYRLKQPEMRSAIEKVAELATEITTGYPISFLEILEDDRGLFPSIKTVDGDFPIDFLSQGTMSLIHCLSHIIFGYAEYYDFQPGIEKEPAIVIIDEIDAHLHPTWQQRIIPTLTSRFPNLQIFCSTHSPLMLAGLGTGQVQLLRRNADGRVTASTNESDIKGWTADEILRQLLELSAPTDLHTAQRVRRLQELRRLENPTAAEEEELAMLRDAVGSQLVSAPLTAEIARLSENLKRVNLQSSPSDQDRIPMRNIDDTEDRDRR